MMKLNPPEEKKTLQKVASRNGKATLNKGFEENNFRSFLKWPPMTLGRLPLNQSSGLQKMAANKMRSRLLTTYFSSTHQPSSPPSRTFGP